MTRPHIRFRWLPLALAALLFGGVAPLDDAIRHPPTSTDPTVVRS